MAAAAAGVAGVAAAASAACCASWTLADVKAVRAEECRKVRARELSWRLDRRGFVASEGSFLSSPRWGRAVVNETANVRDVRDICRHQVALWNVKVAMVDDGGMEVELRGWIASATLNPEMSAQAP